MRHLLSLFICVYIITGDQAMALKTPRPSINQPKIDVIKQEMNFEQFIRQLPPDKRVILDWQALLNEFKDTDGTIWRVDYSSYSFRAEHGVLGLNLKSNQGILGLSVHSLSQGQEDAIDLALFDSTNSNASFVSYKYEPQCPGTFCLVPRHDNNLGSMMFVYGNILIKLNCAESGSNCQSVARFLQASMEKAVVRNPEGNLPSRPQITYVVTPKRVKAGESFTVTAEFGGGYNLDPDFFDVGKELLSSNIEYEEELRSGVYKFTAKSAGPGTVAFSLLDKKTLWVFTDNVPLTIEQ